MKCFLCAIATILLFASCGRTVVGDADPAKESVCDSVAVADVPNDTAVVESVEEVEHVADCLCDDYTGNAKYIERKKCEMLDAMDNDCRFGFSEDTELQSQDADAYWLMNSMMQMSCLVNYADDDWAWMLAMDELIKVYDVRSGSRAGSNDVAVKAIDALMQSYAGGSQMEMNTASYVWSELEHYKTVHAYYRLIESICDKDNRGARIKALLYKEFKEWFDMNDAAQGVMTAYSYARAWYSMASFEQTCMLREWSASRFHELEIESGVFVTQGGEVYVSEAETVSPAMFDELLGYFKSRTKCDIAKEMEAIYGEDSGKCEDYFDFEKIAEYLNRYKAALLNWREVREQIAQMLPGERQDSYREITRQMHARLYNDLSGLKEIHF